MTAPPNPWIPLKPNLRPASHASRMFAWMVGQLTAPDCVGENLAEVRSEALAAADQCEEEQQAYRVLASILCDLRGKGWRFRIGDEGEAIAAPEVGGGTVLDQKEQVRSSLLLERDGQLRTPAVRAFVKGMEQRRLGKSGWVSIYSVMRDGRELAKALREARSEPDGPARRAKLREVIDPFLQVVDGEAVCEQTGLRLADIWRYFRHTWVTSYTNAPGRKFWILVRDRAVKNHPVIGIAAFGNAVVQLGPRDKWIGWRPKEFLETLKAGASREWAVWLQKAVGEMEEAIYLYDFVRDKIVTRKELLAPTEDVISRLKGVADAERKQHAKTPQTEVHKFDDETTSSHDWISRTESHLFRAKRAEALARLLQVRMSLRNVGFTEPTKDALLKVLAEVEGRRAVEIVLRGEKANHIGINLLEITICGAVAPYKAVLGGKLVAMLLTSPEVVQEYERRYRKSFSVIASSTAGRPVQRRPNLVALGTTSLYGAGAAMYNRISIPAAEVGGDPGDVVRYEDLGKSVGFGSIQFSPATVNEIEAILEAKTDGPQINNIFGEGVSPRLRKIRAGMEAVGLPPDKLMQHGTPRIVYGVALAEQFREILIGRRVNRARYFFPFDDSIGVTRRLGDYWVKRWLSRRIDSDEVLAEVERHTLVYPIEHGARVVLPPVGVNEPTLFDMMEEQAD